MAKKTQQELDEALILYLEVYGYRLFNKALRRSIEPILNSLRLNENVLFTSAFGATLYNEQPIADAMSEFYSVAWQRQTRTYYRWLKQNLPNSAIIGAGFDNPILDAKLTEYFNTIGGQHIKDISETTLKRVQSAFQTALDNNEGFRGAERRLIKEVGMSRTRARMIARTESLMITNKAKYEQSELLSIQMEKEWRHNTKSNYREWHFKYNGTKKDFEDTFTLRGVKMKYPGDPNGGAINNVNCRCIMITRAKTDSEGNLIYK